MSPTAALFDLFRMHVRAAVAWERDLLRRVGLLAPSQDGLFDDLADELFARWPAQAQEQGAVRLCESIRWAKLHEPAEPADPAWRRAAPPERASKRSFRGDLSRTLGQPMSWFNDAARRACYVGFVASPVRASQPFVRRDGAPAFVPRAPR